MSLRTYTLIAHPSYLRHVETKLFPESVEELRPADTPPHRPQLTDIYQIAEYLGVSREIIRSTLKFKHRHYREFKIKKRNGSDRVIKAPRTFLKVIQWWILDTILIHTYNPHFLYGFIRGRSYVTNAKAHYGAKHLLNVDLKDFFPSITLTRVAGVFESLGFSNQVALDLAELTTVDGVLPQGAPTSPMLANLVMATCDLALKRLADGLGATYTRYADDLTFSSHFRLPPDLPKTIEAIVRPCGFVLNSSKTLFMGTNDRKEVTGLILGNDGVCLPRDYLNRTRGWFHSAKVRPNEHMEQASRIKGTIELLRQVGGRGSEKLIVLGQEALLAITTAVAAQGGDDEASPGDDSPTS